MLNGAIETQEECTFRAKVYGVMGTFSKSTVRGGQMSRKGKKGEDRKTRFRNDSSKKNLSCMLRNMSSTTSVSVSLENIQERCILTIEEKN